MKRLCALWSGRFSRPENCPTNGTAGGGQAGGLVFTCRLLGRRFSHLPLSSNTSSCNIWLAIGPRNLTNDAFCVPQASIESFPSFGHSNPTTCGGTSITCPHSLPWSEYYRRQDQGWLRIPGRLIAAFGPRVGPHFESIL